MMIAPQSKEDFGREVICRNSLDPGEPERRGVLAGWNDAQIAISFGQDQSPVWFHRSYSKYDLRWSETR